MLPAPTSNTILGHSRARLLLIHARVLPAFPPLGTGATGRTPHRHSTRVLPVLRFTRALPRGSIENHTFLRELLVLPLHGFLPGAIGPASLASSTLNRPAIPPRFHALQYRRPHAQSRIVSTQRHRATPDHRSIRAIIRPAP